jgi:hypothetical protein
VEAVIGYNNFNVGRSFNRIGRVFGSGFKNGVFRIRERWLFIDSYKRKKLTDTGFLLWFLVGLEFNFFSTIGLVFQLLEKAFSQSTIQKYKAVRSIAMALMRYFFSMVNTLHK